ncbi:MAG: hypothetical protein KIS96_05075 [Bauldia sp.]|nr:hypothetical protein [Bauldia sp.]
MARLTKEEIEQRDYEDAVRWQAERDAAEARGEAVGGTSLGRIRSIAKWAAFFIAAVFIFNALRRML